MNKIKNEAKFKKRAEIKALKANNSLKRISYKDIDLKEIYNDVLNGFSSFDIMKKHNISYDTFYSWIGNSKYSKKDFKETIQRAKKELLKKRINIAENSLNKLIKGHTTTKIITETVYDKNDDVLRTIKKEIVEEHSPNYQAIAKFLETHSKKYNNKNIIDIDINNNQNEYAINILQVGEIIEADRDDSTIQKVVDYTEEV